MDNSKAESCMPHADNSQRRSELNRRFLSSGFDNFGEEDIIELMMYYCVPKNKARENAERLLNELGNISDILDADPRTLMKTGASEKCAVFFRVITAISGRYYNSAESGTIYDSTEKLIGLFRPHFAGLSHEEFRIACFNNDMSLIMTETVSKGSGVSADVDHRVLTEVILRNECSVAAVAHNHPNASCEPSDSDLRFTADLYRILKTMDIELADHIIVGKQSAMSLKDEYPLLFP